MLKVIHIILLILTIYGFVFSQNQSADYETNIFHDLRDKDFRNLDLTPLLPDDLANFKGLNYFAFDNNYRINASFVKSIETKSFLMPTSNGKSRKYLKIGDFSFKLNGNELSLGAYFFEYALDHPKSKEKLIDVFVPFKDSTNGVTSYSAGRYVYVRLPKDGENAILDFNLAYNPSCAYGNENYSCTLPPKENFLQVEIKAGEKRFK